MGWDTRFIVTVEGGRLTEGAQERLVDLLENLGDPDSEANVGLLELQDMIEDPHSDASIEITPFHPDP